MVDDEASNRNAVEEVKKVTGRLDIVIANELLSGLSRREERY